MTAKRNSNKQRAGKKSGKKAGHPTAAAKKAGKAKAAKKTSLVRTTPAAAPKSRPSAHSPVVDIALRAIEDMKGVNVTTIDVRDKTDIADHMIIASGNSDRHVSAIAERVIEFAKKAGHRPMGVEGERDGEWVLVDLQDVIVHIMLPRVREFYRLESLWDVTAARREAAGQ